ncbi:uncharacterized protein LOC142332748 [Lycorma delicatula]|uniref:uncharacterized protein LOC142332748 n=1 Tax=Lycorma delicatula TaxID=130591 RepID=UPI003F51A88C
MLEYVKCTPDNLTISSGQNPKARLATMTIFNLAHRHGDKLEKAGEMYSIVVDLLQLKEEQLDVINGDIEKDPLVIEETDSVKRENVKVENERVIIDKCTYKGSTKNSITHKRCVNNSVYDGVIKEKSNEYKRAYGDVTKENLIKDINSENKICRMILKHTLLHITKRKIMYVNFVKSYSIQMLFRETC